MELTLVRPLDSETRLNRFYRRVLTTTNRSQLVLSSLLPYQDLGEEKHKVDQFLKVDQGEGYALLNGTKYPLVPGMSVSVPAGTTHNIVNTSAERMQLYTIYSPALHSPKEEQRYREYPVTASEEDRWTVSFRHRNHEPMLQGAVLNLETHHPVWRNDNTAIVLYNRFPLILNTEGTNYLPKDFAKISTVVRELGFNPSEMITKKSSES